MNTNTLLLTLILAALSFLIIQPYPSEPINVKNETVSVVNETVDVKEINRKIIKKQPKPNITVTDGYRHIQNAEHDSDPELYGQRLSIDDVDRLMNIYGSSMAPSIMEGDTLLLKKYEGQSLETGQIIAFDYNDKTVAHRIVGDYQQNGYVLTRGDNNEYSERTNISSINYVVKGVVYG